MGFLGESAPPASCLGGPNRGWHAVTARILGVSMAEPEKEILIILAHTLPPQMGVAPLGSCARRCAPVLLQFNSTSQEVFP